MRHFSAVVLDVTTRVYPNLEQIVGLPEELKGIEVLTTGKSIDLRSNTRKRRLSQMEGLQELQHFWVGNSKLYKLGITAGTLT